ncbi:lipid II:glycine glycyltransferase FemX [Jeotgalibacillus salarius]|uniref:Lipid II:glycine glycyltransferase n=1 Tax=Jeotgalibacillus salarius TaxID=546023 RepID=A0A4Y8LG20_9BACL|nr:GNAT family N-acetyltransferase [Jeotgalibacillus salarius]TFE01712.1 GNAT family N-acetyltransferase [Jeotgalibacillus salarius]
MSMFEVITQKECWNQAMEQFQQIDGYYTFSYGQAFAIREEGELMAVYFEAERVKLFYSFIKRKIDGVDMDVYDLVSPYGYGGPHIECQRGNSVSEVLPEFLKCFRKFCLENNIVTETIRYHPLYGNGELFKNDLPVDYVRKTVGVDLSPSLDEIRMGYSSSNRRNIRAAIRNGLSCEVVPKTERNIRLFTEMYHETMKRNEAAPYYFFSEELLHLQLEDTSTNKTELLFVEHKGKIVGGAILMIGPKYAYYHLGASLSEALLLRPNNLLFDFMVKRAREEGAEVLYLGGGTGENDSLFRFKASFSQGCHYNFYVGKVIHDSDLYTRILQEGKADGNTDYFPLYRSGQWRFNVRLKNAK